ncbi:hypothetical protein QUF72_08360 [Desulfobacterales bacterium HSG2]|nr:hypothetical protein [Desulfobacterales bacterium HSG2]
MPNPPAWLTLHAPHSSRSSRSRGIAKSPGMARPSRSSLLTLLTPHAPGGLPNPPAWLALHAPHSSRSRRIAKSPGMARPHCMARERERHGSDLAIRAEREWERHGSDLAIRAEREGSRA